MELTGDVSEVYSNGRFVIWTTDRPVQGVISVPTGSTSMSTVASTSSAQSNTASSSAVSSKSMTLTSASSQSESSDASTAENSESAATPSPTGAMATPISMAGSKPKSNSGTDGLNVVAEAPIVDGEFTISYEVSEPKVVSFYVLDSVSEGGMRMAPIKGQRFILEEGQLKLTMNSRARFVIEGGKYNDIVFNSWKQSDEYVALQEEYNLMLSAPEGETEEERLAREKAIPAKFNELLELENDGRGEVALNHPDTRARRFVLETTWLMDDWYSPAINELAAMDPDDPWIQARLQADKESQAMIEKQNKIAVGTHYLDFNAETLDGDQVTLSDVEQESKFVLIEFWASWCGPCRQEIPNLKKAYEKYHSEGFEIVSFTIDESHEAWETASDQEELPWLNWGMGEESEAPTKYVVSGVPASILFDADTGLIVAKNLRGEQLEAKLDELFH